MERPPERPAQSRLIAMRRELATAREKLAQLQAAAGALQQTSDRFSSEESRQLAAELAQARSELTAAVERKNDLLESAGRVQTGINRIATELSERTQSLKDTASELAQVSQQLQQELRSRSRSTSLPTVRDWHGQVAPFFLAERRLCALKTPVGGYLRINEAECRLVSEAGGTAVEPIVPAGLFIDPKFPDTAALARKLQPFDPSRHLIQVWVTPDSFEAFAVVKQALVAGGFRYDIRPIPEGERLGLTNSPVRLRAQ